MEAPNYFSPPHIPRSYTPTEPHLSHHVIYKNVMSSLINLSCTCEYYDINM